LIAKGHRFDRYGIRRVKRLQALGFGVVPAMVAKLLGNLLGVHRVSPSVEMGNRSIFCSTYVLMLPSLERVVNCQFAPAPRGG
jgi:hypothetical protein